jgi:hypothetical protein
MCSCGRRGLRGIARLRRPLRITCRSALHLHFELWVGGPGRAIDPAALMKSWQVFTPSDIAPFLSSTRNAAKGPARRSEFVHVTAHERRWPGTALHPPR